jgi:hypothetical protein
MKVEVEQSGIRILAAARGFVSCTYRQTDSGVQSASYSIITGVLSQWNSGRIVKLTVDPAEVKNE